MANQIRLPSGGRIEVLGQGGSKQETLYQFPIMVGSCTVQQNPAGSSDHESKTCGVDYLLVNIGELWPALKNGESTEAGEGAEVVLLIRKQVMMRDS
jgi:hypothetical protein